MCISKPSPHNLLYVKCLLGSKHPRERGKNESRGEKEELRDCAASRPEDKRQINKKRHFKGTQREEHFYRSHLLLPRKKVVYITMVIYCQMANQQQKKNKKYFCHPFPKSKENSHSNTMIIYFLDNTSAIFLSFFFVLVYLFYNSCKVPKYSFFIMSFHMLESRWTVKGRWGHHAAHYKLLCKQ